MNGEALKTMTLSLSPDDMARLEKLLSAEQWEIARAVDCMRAIDALRADEGNEVTILCDNPDGRPNNAIECCGAWTHWGDRRFEGDTLADTLSAAVRAMKASSDG